MSDLGVVQLFRKVNLAEIGAVGDGTADRIDSLVADDQIEICTFRTERVVAGRADFRTPLPPPVLSGDHLRF